MRHKRWARAGLSTVLLSCPENGTEANLQRKAADASIKLGCCPSDRFPRQSLVFKYFNELTGCTLHLQHDAAHATSRLEDLEDK